jgi:NAD(P)-dependent dehydrogenase (short-subunit alcohol dehydrogenase family)
MRLENKVALVTGGSQGIGFEIARRFLEEGATVFIGDVHQAPDSGGTPAGAVFVNLNVASEESWKAAFQEIRSKEGRLDILVNNAGINIRKDIEAMPEESLDAMLAVNLRAGRT